MKIPAYSSGNFIRRQIVIHAVEKSEVGKGIRQSEIGSGDAFLKRKVRKLLIEFTCEQRSEGNESYSHK